MMLTVVFASACVRQPGPPPVPDFTTPTPTTESAPRAIAPNVARDGPAGTFVYTMQPGDTLFSLANRFGTTVDILIALNGIQDVSDIPSGLVLFIPEVPPTPTPTATPQATATPTGGPSVRIDNGPRNSGAVALTFDMGGRVEPALDIMNWLVANEVRATIFMTGAMANNPNTDAGREVLAIVDAHPGLFELGNHSYGHPDFRDLTASQMREELHSTESAVAQYTDMPMRPLFRPPYGGLDQAVLNGVGPAGYGYTIMWDVDTIDWLPEADDGPTTQEMVAKVVNNAQGGSIVLMHLGGYNTFAALPGMVAGLEARGFEFARVSELLD